MSHLPLFEKTPLDEAFKALRRDLIHEDGPAISTMRNYRFAIVQYDPTEEFKLRRHTQALARELEESGWEILSINLFKLLLNQAREQEDGWIDWIADTEAGFAKDDLEAGLEFLEEELGQLTEGLAQACIDEITAHIKRHSAGNVGAERQQGVDDCEPQGSREWGAEHPDKRDRTLVLIGRVGGVYPFFRASALLKHLDGATHHVPVILLYPGERRGATGLSFMGELKEDNDYRPRIYP